MPWCPNCKSEYREGFDKCNDCGEKLVDEIKEDNEIKERIDDKVALLMNVRDHREADIIESLLKEEGILLFQRHKAIGDYMKVYMGSSKFGLDLFVLSKDLDRAKEIVENVRDTRLEDLDMDNSVDGYAEEYEDLEVKREKQRNVFRVLIIIPIIFILILTLLARVLDWFY